MKLRREEHPKVAWVADHLVLLYVAFVVTALLPLAIVEFIR